MTGLSFARERHFPKLAAGNYRVTSDETSDYNCFAWAFLSTDRWFGPPFAPDVFESPEAFAEGLMSWFLDLARASGFEPCESADTPGYEHLALYVSAGEPLHVSRLLSTGRWTSKLGRWEDIEHDDAGALEGPLYGSISGYFRRPEARPAP